MDANQNTLVVISDTNSSLRSTHVDELVQFSKVTGKPLSEILNRAIDNFMNIEAPVYLDHAKRQQA